MRHQNRGFSSIRTVLLLLLVTVQLFSSAYEDEIPFPRRRPYESDSSFNQRMNDYYDDVREREKRLQIARKLEHERAMERINVERLRQKELADARSAQLREQSQVEIKRYNAEALRIIKDTGAPKDVSTATAPLQPGDKSTGGYTHGGIWHPFDEGKTGPGTFPPIVREPNNVERTPNVERTSLLNDATQFAEEQRTAEAEKARLKNEDAMMAKVSSAINALTDIIEKAPRKSNSGQVNTEGSSERAGEETKRDFGDDVKDAIKNVVKRGRADIEKMSKNLKESSKKLGDRANDLLDEFQLEIMEHKQ